MNNAAAMTDPDFEDDSEFDIGDISSIIKDIDSANLAMDAMESRADKLTANILSLLKAQSLPSPYDNTEPELLEQVTAVSTTTLSNGSESSTNAVTTQHTSPSTASSGTPSHSEGNESA
ncbi:hypothetical protein BGZ98_009845 [Dissophora globulifera]|nr:hypothetical protein BGZ98_009845 [Dissophora globulifera]